MSLIKNYKSNSLFIYIIVFSQFSMPFMFSGVSVTLPSMGRELGATTLELSLVETIYLGSCAAFLLTMGRLGALCDKRSIFKLGLALFALSSFLIGFMPSIDWLLGLRFFQGLSSAMLEATAFAMITELTTPERRGQAIGFSVGAIYGGLALGPLIAGYITEYMSWHWVFWIFSVPMALCCLVSVVILKSQWQAPTEPIHYLGVLLNASALIVLIFGSSILEVTVWSYFILAAGGGLLVLFVLSQFRAKYPILTIEHIVSNNPFREALFINFLLYASAFGSTFLYSIYLQVVRGFTPESSGLVLALGSVVMALTAPFSGRLADKFSPRLLTACGSMCVLFSMMLAIQIDNKSPIEFVVLVLLLQGLGFSFFSSPNIKIIMNSVPLSLNSIASALTAKTRIMGMLVCMLVITSLLSVMGGGQPVDNHADSFLTLMHSAFGLFIILSGLCVAVCLRAWLKDSNLEIPQG